MALVRYTASGELVVDFGKGGMVTTAIGSRDDTGQRVVVQGDRKIIVVGATWDGDISHIALVRYTASGALDPSFGTGGIVTTDFGDSCVGSDVAVHADGKIVVAGWTWNGSNRDFALARYTANGALDTGFGLGGKAVTDLGGRDDYGFGVAVQSDGKIVVAGFSEPGGRNAIALVRYEGGSVAPPLALRIGQPLPGTFTLTLTGWPNATNRIEFADRLLSLTGTVWHLLGTVKLDGQGTGMLTDLPAAPMRLYRAVAP
jgi:uncharacterized delta-60 repeat protein